MGSLKPGATYVYERHEGTVYAREFGADPNTRQPIGWEHPIDPRTSDGRPLHDHIMEDKLWGEIRRASRTNEALHEALERVKILYYLGKDNGKK
jgi:hypothetical protein